MNKFDRIIAVILIVVVTLTTTNIKCLAEENETETVVYNDKEYQIAENTKKEVVVESEEDGYIYESTYDKNTDEINIVCSEDGFLFDKEIGDFTVNVISYDEAENILEYDVINNDTGEVTHVSDSDMQAQLPWVAGVAIGEIVTVLLATCAVMCVYEGVKYVAISMSKIREQNYYCYCAYLYKGKVGIGPALTYKEAVAYAKNTKKVKNVGVFCAGDNAKAKAKKIAKNATKNGNIVHHDKHDNSEGYYKHYHPAKKAGDAYHFHSWYYVY